MDYTRIYEEIVVRAKRREKPAGYTERHHVIPKSEGGADTEINIAILTAREHLICHWLLWRILKTKESAAAFNAMRLTPSKNNKRYKNARAYAEAKAAAAKMYPKKKRRQAKTKNRPDIKPCKHCGKVTRYVKNMALYHGENCWSNLQKT